MKRTVLLCALVCLNTSAYAEVFKCKEGNKVVFSDVPCAEGTQQDPSKQLSRIRSAAVGERKIYRGMKEDDVLEAWGKPDQKSSDGKRQLWMYKIDEYRTQYVHIENGAVSNVTMH